MNEQEREKPEDLIGGFLDGELSQRQRTELKRMAQHDPCLKRELHSLYRQKEVLSALPVEKAPEGLAAEVRSRLERRMILDAEPASEIRPIGHAHLLIRRIAAVAAMLFIPLGILAIIVFQIMKPADDVLPSGVPVAEMDSTGELARLERSLPVGLPETAAAISLGRLTLSTDQPIEVNDAIKKAVLDNQLLSGANSERTESGAIYRIQCSQQQMLSFHEDLAGIWPKCSRQQLAVSIDDSAEPPKAVIDGIRPDQMKTLIAESNPVRLRMIASYLERQNKPDASAYLREVRPGSGESGEVVLRPVEPKIAWNADRPAPPGSAAEGPENDPSPDGPQVILVIEVTSTFVEK